MFRSSKQLIDIITLFTLLSDAEMMSDTETETELSTEQRYAVVAAAGLVALLVGVLLAPTVAGIVDGDDSSEATAPDEAVAVVTVEGQVTQSLAEDLESELRTVRANDSVEAVVIRIDTPGGAPAPSEQMYTAIKRTSKEVPVIASVAELSASGGYYAMLGADDIFVHPTSITGSVGLAAPAPQPTPPVEGPSGPDKRGQNEIQGWAQQELLAQVFIESVMAERGDRIELSREEVATADVFLGVRAVENGMADEIGGREAAIKEAANRAGLDEYTVIERDVSPAQSAPFFIQTDQGIVAVHSSNPGYNDIEPVPATMIYKPAVPHYETIQKIVQTDRNVSAAKGGEQP